MRDMRRNQSLNGFPACWFLKSGVVIGVMYKVPYNFEPTHNCFARHSNSNMKLLKYAEMH